MAIRQFAAKRGNSLARARIQLTGGDSRSAVLGNKLITIERTAELMGVTIEVATHTLVGLRTYLHNRFIVPRLTALPDAEVNQFATGAALAAEAACTLASAIDEIDEVAVRLDLRVLERQPVHVPLGNPPMYPPVAAPQTVHQAVLFALRPYLHVPESQPQDDWFSVKQLLLPMPMPVPELVGVARLDDDGADAGGCDASIGGQLLRVVNKRSPAKALMRKNREPRRVDAQTTFLIPPSAKAAPSSKGREGAAPRQ